MYMLRNGSKTILAACLVLVLLLLTGCPGFSDWEYDLPNDYMIIRVNSQDIQFGKGDEEQYTRLIDRYIVSFCFSDRYIGLQRIPIDTPYNELFRVEELDRSNIEFYLIDSETGTTYGPWTAAEYDEQIKILSVSGMSAWQSTSSNPGHEGEVPK